MNTLRLILTYKCPRSCEGCCNTQEAFVASNVPEFDLVKESFDKWDTVILTGGEPLVNFKKLKFYIRLIRIENPDARIIVYTANVHMRKELTELLYLVDGITITVHDQADVDDFRRLNFWWQRLRRYKMDNNKTLRLNVFKGVDLYMQNSSLWNIKDNIEWIADCPLPGNEEIRKLKYKESY